MSERPDWDSQFAEDEEERRERWRATKLRRIAEGKCWQCAKPAATMPCPACGAGAYLAADPSRMKR